MAGRSNPEPPTIGIAVPTDAPLFLWRGAGVVLIGDYADSRWLLTRGWVAPGALRHVRRWSFTGSAGLQTQVRRLTREATGDASLAAAAHDAAVRWTAGRLAVDPG